MRFAQAPMAVAQLALLVLLGLAGCATRPPADDPESVAEYEQTNDPAEPTNRAMYAVHQRLDDYLLRPAAVIYRDGIPRPIRLGVHNMLSNLRSPVVLTNDILQGEPRRAGDTAGRFLINSTLGVGGVLDVARDHFGVAGHVEDFGQTFAHWGIGEGAFLFVPVIGPTNLRDLIGFGVGVVADPFFWFGQGVAVAALTGSRTAATVLDVREGLIETLDEVQRTSMDPYATLRSGYRQRRRAEIENRSDPRAPLPLPPPAAPR